MSNGANQVHKELRSELEGYIRSQYFGKSPLLLNAINGELDTEGLLYQKPYIESSPAYKTEHNGIQRANIPAWVKEYFSKLCDAGLGVFPAPFVHQIEALEAAIQGKELFVATGTGSGKTECFMWPLMAKLASEARNSPAIWSHRGVRTIVMYPMNALVSDQVGRLRKLIGDPAGQFIRIFRDTCGKLSRRPQFGMYTGRTPYPGPEPDQRQDRRLRKTLERMSFPQGEQDQEYFAQLSKEGKIPAKYDMRAFLDGLYDGRHIPHPEDAELITRFEMQQCCPDILITNYSMLEYMLLRPREAKIWEETKAWLHASKENKLLFIIDEAHMYRGSSGGEVALLLRRLFHKLGIDRSKVQFILTTASMPDADEDDKKAVMQFANGLTAADKAVDFRYLTGVREEISGMVKYDIPAAKLISADPNAFEADNENKLLALQRFWHDLPGTGNSFEDLDAACAWMYDHLLEYKPFHAMVCKCRGTAVSLGELAAEIFPELSGQDAMHSASVLLSITPLARNRKGSVLFPARMHMLFRGIRGVYACANPNCHHSHTDGSLTLGEIMLSDSSYTCPECGSVVYELYNDRRCGALFYKGYVLKEDMSSSRSVYLWHYPGQQMDNRMKEVHLYIPPDDYSLPKKQGSHPIKPCYLDINSGFINFKDDSAAGKDGYRKLYFCDFSAKGRPQIITFPTCPHCRHQLSSFQLTSFNTRGNESFYNLIRSQFQLQPAVPGKDKDPERLPNQGRKVLLFSDSRQRAARLARDMSEASDITAARQLFALAIHQMETSVTEHSMNDLYGYFCLAAAQHHVQIFHGPERDKFAEDCATEMGQYTRATRRRKEYSPRYSIANAPLPMQKFLLRLFSGGYNTLYDSATSWIAPTDEALFDALDALEEAGYEISEEEFLAIFNAWMISICDSATALGHTIPDEVRLEVRHNYGGYGLSKDWTFSQNITDIMDWEKNSDEMAAWHRVLKEGFLDHLQSDNGRLYVDLTRVKPRFDAAHEWYRCEQCSEITPYPLRNRCPSCGADTIHKMAQSEYEALQFWRQPIEDALDGSPIHVIDTEEHTAQLSHKDQRDELWSQTEQYELRFQDLIQEGETPVDILSSTTTMEVGIDIGSLVAVGLRNIPPMRENYQQRAGRAGRRGSSLSTIVSFCEDGPHDTLYFKDPVPMFRGDPRRPWIDIASEKLIQRHLAMVIFQEYLYTHRTSLDMIPAHIFLDTLIPTFLEYAARYSVPSGDLLIPQDLAFSYDKFIRSLSEAVWKLKEKRDNHPELYGAGDNAGDNDAKSLLDALYEEGIIPTYSFPKNVVSTYIMENGRVKYEVERGLDVAIGEYAPGRAVVVDKQTYQIGGLYFPKSDFIKGASQSPAKAYVNDANYLKPILTCKACGWFGLEEDNTTECPFCGNSELIANRPMLKPWGFAPRNAESTPEAQLIEEYSPVQQPLYSTLPDAEGMITLPGYEHVRMASRSNQRIIMMNKGASKRGFMVCSECGAAMPGDTPDVLKAVERPYKSRFAKGKCRHSEPINVDLGYDFVTDMLVLEFELDPARIDANRQDSPWLPRAAQSLAEAIRLAASQELDIEFTELVTGYRLRSNRAGCFVDIYLYDSLSSGAGYSVRIADDIVGLLEKTKRLLSECGCSGACHHCLKHYRNQHIHGMLDRFAALELLRWGKEDFIARPLSLAQQKHFLLPLANILSSSGCNVSISDTGILVTGGKNTKQIQIYPAMWVEPKARGTISVSDALIKYAKPYAVQKILDELE